MYGSQFLDPCHDPTPGLPAKKSASLRRAARPDDLVVDASRVISSQGQIAPVLQDHLHATTGIRDQVREALHRQGCPYHGQPRRWHRASNTVCATPASSRPASPASPSPSGSHVLRLCITGLLARRVTETYRLMAHYVHTSSTGTVFFPRRRPRCAEGAGSRSPTASCASAACAIANAQVTQARPRTPRPEAAPTSLCGEMMPTVCVPLPTTHVHREFISPVPEGGRRGERRRCCRSARVSPGQSRSRPRVRFMKSWNGAVNSGIPAAASTG